VAGAATGSGRAGDRPSLFGLIADEVTAAALWLFVVAGVLALWRARRLGRVVEEPLPVVVRAAEAVEGRARLYRAAGARGTAAESLRAATRDRVVRRVGLPPGADRPAVVELLAERTGSEPTVLDALLYGDAPADDRRWSGSPTTSARWSPALPRHRDRPASEPRPPTTSAQEVAGP
jgi:hypothetical protein